MSTEQNKAKVLKFFDEVCNKGQTNLITEIFAEKVTFNGTPGTPDNVRKYLKEIQTSFINAHVEVNKQIVEGDWVSTMRTWGGIQKATYRDKPSTGKRMTWTEISIVRLQDLKIVDDWVVQSELSATPDHEECGLTGKDNLELWKYFSNHADQVKQRLWTTVIWHFTALSALLAFITKSFMNFDPSVSSGIITQPPLFSLFSFVGLLFCVFTILFMKGYGYHIKSNWNYADRAREKIERLNSILKPDNKPSIRRPGWFFGLPSDARHILIVTSGFVLIYVFLSTWSVIRLIAR